MIYFPETDYTNFKTGFWWSDTPTEEISPRFPNFNMGLDPLDSDPLTPEQKNFPNNHWGVIRAKTGKKGDVFQDFASRCIVVSDRIASIIEGFEPNLHDLIPIPRLWSIGDQEEIAQKHYFLNVHAKARTVDLERANIRRSVQKKTGRHFVTLQALTKTGRVVYANASEARHLWRDDVTLAAFMSAELVAAMEAENVAGFDFEECTLV